MGIWSLEKIIFLKAFLATDTFPEVVNMIEDTRDGQPIYKKSSNQKSIKAPKTIVIQDVPSYFRLHTDSHKNKFSLKKVSTQKTYVVNLDKYTDGSEYLSKHFGAKSRSALKRYKNRLEKCFTIRYQAYYGAMERKQYDDIFGSLEGLMIRRFRQKNEQNYELQHLTEIKEDVYPRLLQKQASLFVIYANDTPISIRINMMKAKLAFYILSAFDPDYDLFRLGKLDMWQNIEWLIAQGYSKYDLLKGYGYIKEKWADTVYANELVIITDQGSLWGKSTSLFLVWVNSLKIRLLKFIRLLQLDRVIKLWKKSRLHDQEKMDVEIIDLDEHIQTEVSLDKKPIDPLERKKLAKAIFQLGYTLQCPIEEILVYRKNGAENEYYAHFQSNYYLLKVN
ncbi:GNAT family N-acetyltransferase [Flagellimonas aequoris]|uniref:GNAT family N-acetyltransferase n=1 Tax=Flagellimonas aequoris TaxID=2306997 RepID=A0A418NCM4_9FLAO|nr:GNAT family N-acetyltransferase [Allomuricauda aequoris]RIV74409.1 GNAT family N-acetyltransferase [Allomuricauda aequoris]TXK08531.1 GNAT family N-acetyltransferase [Allomuricauda aequoris]